MKLVRLFSRGTIFLLDDVLHIEPLKNGTLLLYHEDDRLLPVPDYNSQNLTYFNDVVKLPTTYLGMLLYNKSF